MIDPKTQNSTNLLSSAQLEQVIVDVVRSFDTELARIPSENNLKILLEHFLREYHDRDLFTFFTLQSLQSLSSDIFTNEHRRAFVLNLTERAMQNWSCSDIEYDTKFIGTLVKWISYNKATRGSKTSFINQEVIDSIHVTPDVLKTHFTDNPWMAVYYLLLVNMHRSAVFQELKKSSKAK